VSAQDRSARGLIWVKAPPDLQWHLLRMAQQQLFQRLSGELQGGAAMLRLDRTQGTWRRLEVRPMKSAGVLERADLQRMIRDTSSAFCDEIGEKLLVLGEEVSPSDVVDDRIDILALDEEGSVVVLELKRGTSKLHLLQALSYAAMVSGWEGDGIVAQYAKFRQFSAEEAEEKIEEFLAEDIAALNERQRILLFAEEYDYQVLATAKWLSEKHDVDIACWQMELAHDDGAEYLSFACVYPPVELANAARMRGRRGNLPPMPWPDWDTALEAVTNPAVVSFYRQRLAENVRNNLRRCTLIFSIGGRSRFGMRARARHAGVRQRGRFDDDVQFWRERLGDEANIHPIADGRALRFSLTTTPQFEAFWKAGRTRTGEQGLRPRAAASCLRRRGRMLRTKVRLRD
jgi:hypothetical protein